MLAAVRRPDRVAALGLFEPSMQWQPWWPAMDAIAAEAPYEQTHFRAGLEDRAAPHAARSATANRRCCSTS